MGFNNQTDCTGQEQQTGEVSGYVYMWIDGDMVVMAGFILLSLPIMIVQNKWNKYSGLNPPDDTLFCVEFASSPWVCQSLWLPSNSQKHPVAVNLWL